MQIRDRNAGKTAIYFKKYIFFLEVCLDLVLPRIGTKIVLSKDFTDWRLFTSRATNIEQRLIRWKNIVASWGLCVLHLVLELSISLNL